MRLFFATLRQPAARGGAAQPPGPQTVTAARSTDVAAALSLRPAPASSTHLTHERFPLWAPCSANPRPFMNTSHSCIPHAVRSRLLGVGLAALLAPALSWAQAASSTESADSNETLKLDKFVVTGSMIPVAADSPSVPITVMTAADISRTGEIRDLTDALKKVNPFFFGRGNLGAENANTRANATNGASTVALRNRPTLVLINGRRAALAPVAATGGATFIDVSLIPVTAVERVEVLADGASAIYGTDAVSGVVNVILKTNFQGVELGGTYGWAPDAGNYTTRRAYVTMGAGNDRTQVTITGEWRRTDPLFQYERPWGLNQFRTPTFAGVVTADAGSTLYYLNPNLNAPPTNTDMTLAQLVAAGIYQGPYTSDQIAQFFDLSAKATMFQKTNRRSLAIAGEHKWTENITAFADIVVTSSETESSLNAQPVTGNVLGANPNNPFDVTVQARNRFVDFPRIRQGETLGARAVVGLRGQLAGTWNYEVGASLNRTTQNLRQVNLIDSPAYTAAVNANTYNPFARRQAPGVLEGIVGTGYQDYTSRLVSFDARFTGEVMDLPAGPLMAGLSLETRKETLSMVNDRNDRQALWLGGTPTNPFAAAQSVDSFGAEVRVPIFSAAQSRPFFHTLELTVAARKELYNSTTDPLVPKVSLRWLPMNDEFAIRGTYGESFNAPALFSLFGPSNAGFTNSITLARYDSNGNPMNVVTGNRQYQSRGGSNPNLIPSESRNWTVGFVWSPRAVKGFSLSFDWFNIDEKDIVGAIPQNVLLQDVERFGPASIYASFVRLGTSVGGELLFDTGAPVTAPGQITAGAPASVWMTNPSRNIAGLEQSGADLRLDYVYDTGSWGRFKASVAATYLHEYIVQTAPSTAPVDYAGTFTLTTLNGISSLPSYRTFTQLDWTFKNLTAGVSHTYVPELDDVATPVVVPIEAYHSFDFRVGYSFANSGNRWVQGLRLSAGVNNVFNEDPPFSVGEPDQNRDINTYDALGRFFYVSASYKF
jgi:iron complex outermembrane receptor protein